MTARIFWFSGTGNSLALAKRIADGLGDAELVSVASAMKAFNAGNAPSNADALDVIGFVFPVYAFGEPRIVHRFLSQYPIPQSAYSFLVVAPAGSAGAAIARTSRALSNRGLTLNAAHTVLMPNNYIPFGTLESKEKQTAKIESAAQQIDGIIDDIRKRKANPIADPLFKRWFFTLALKASMAAFPTMDKKFSVNDRCCGCGLCEKICPVGNIRMENEEPVWRHDCEHCLACYHWCPTQAIQFKKRTDRGQYRHPDVSANELII